ncbi:hypothetical protein BCR33DRAFT_24431 [Rhizoclosmatium globosum]|uniref:Uncharacterized protein n=1 Tax=Rhizoclosmatium globosum TaxID=329046 RepID=A0A1Y2AXS7_9FUNG|nr:hypothetical protein BCR33DRAFT_24431 [Rhizoclosmatium globosum]|eukprot:ORY27254.1 hypothetical protein BCR33DRAFT_24431 [Rhizoclosmatium globosum]
MHAFTTHHHFSSYSFNNSSPSSNPSTTTTTTKDRTLPRRSPSPNSGITWNPLSIRNKPTSNHIRLSCCCNAQPSAIYYSSQRNRRVNAFGTRPSSFLGCLAYYFNCNRHSNSRRSTNQINSINCNFCFYDYLSVHVYIYNFFFFHKQSSVPDIKTLHLSHISLTSIADFSANIRRVLAEQLTQFHPYQLFWFTKPSPNTEKGAPNVVFYPLQTMKVLQRWLKVTGGEGSGDDREVDDVGSVDVGVAAWGRTTKNKKKRKKKKVAVAGVEEANVDVAPD